MIRLRDALGICGTSGIRRIFRILQGQRRSGLLLRSSLGVGGLRRASRPHGHRHESQNPWTRMVLELPFRPLGAQLGLSPEAAWCIDPSRPPLNKASQRSCPLLQRIHQPREQIDSGARDCRRAASTASPWLVLVGRALSSLPCPGCSGTLSHPFFVPHAPLLNVQRHREEMPRSNSVQH